MNLAISLSAMVLVFMLAFTAYVFERKRIITQTDLRVTEYLSGLNTISTIVLNQLEKDDLTLTSEKLSPYFTKGKFIGSGYFFFYSDKNKISITPNPISLQKDLQIAKELIRTSLQNTRTEYDVNEGNIDGKAFYYYQKVSDGYYVIGKLYKVEAYAPIKEMIITMITFSPFVFSFFFLIILYFSNALVKPIKQGVWFAQEIFKGDLTASLNVKRDDEIGQLANALNTMAVKLKDIVKSISDASGEISQGSSQISEGSQVLASGANEQASTIEELASSLEEITSSVQQVTESASNANSISNEVAKAIVGIGNTANASNSAIKQISEKIRVISDIALQTNILALNAAVEAARAGEYGKGFSVVADEVRKLAEGSKQAADDINDTSSKTLETTNRANQLLQKLIPEVQQTAEYITEIVATATEQLRNIEQVNTSVQGLNEMSQQNSMSAEKLTAGAAALDERAKGFETLMRFFRTK